MSYRNTFLVSALLAVSAVTGCSSFKLKPPAGFVEVENDSYGAHMKGGDEVGLKVSVFENVKGGTLAFWSKDMVEKLGRRGYVLTGQTPAKSRNGVHGTRLDFEYTPPGKDQSKRFYSAVLFATDLNRVVVQMAGKFEHFERYSERVDVIATATKVRGCRAWTDICKGDQPGSLSAMAAAPAAPASTVAGS